LDIGILSMMAVSQNYNNRHMTQSTKGSSTRLSKNSSRGTIGGKDDEEEDGSEESDEGLVEISGRDARNAVLHYTKVYD